MRCPCLPDDKGDDHTRGRTTDDGMMPCVACLFGKFGGTGVRTAQGSGEGDTGKI
jgi:hypothetical protein